MTKDDQKFWLKERTLTLWATGKHTKAEAIEKAKKELEKMLAPKPSLTSDATKVNNNDLGE